MTKIANNIKKDLRETSIFPKIQVIFNSLKNYSKEVPILLFTLKEAKIIYRKKTNECNLDFYTPSKPIIGNLELNKNCNLSCIMCNRGSTISPNIQMDIDLFEKIIQYGKTLGQNSFNLWQLYEPLLNQRLLEYLKILRKLHARAIITTNGLLIEKNIDLICEYSDVIRSITFSIDGASKETYEKIRIPGKFEALIRNLEIIQERKLKSKFFPEIFISSIVSSDVQHELAHHLKFYSKYAIMKNISLNLVSGPPNNNSYFFEKTIFKNHIKKFVPCPSLNQIHILIDGRVSACCGELSGDLIYGSINDNTPMELFNNEIINQFREYHLNNNLPPNISCSSCFRTDKVVNDLWDFFYKTMILKNAKSWDVDVEQKKFDRFFKIFQSTIPTEEEYLSLFK